MVLQKDSLMHSLYEIETTVKRSSRAKGLSWGLSEEAGKAVRLLEQSEFQGLESFKRLIDLGLSGLNKLLDINQSDTSNLCPIHFGIFFLDQSHNKDIHRSHNFKNLNEPLLILPFLSKSAKNNLLYFHFHSSNLNFTISPGDIYFFDQNIFPEYISDFSISITTQRKSIYSQSTWDYLYKLSLETFVEETEEKKISGAGAGLTDND